MLESVISGGVRLSIKALDSSECVQPELEKVYVGNVISVNNFGAFVRRLLGIKGLLRIFRALVGFKPGTSEVPDELGKVHEGKVVEILQNGEEAIVRLPPGIDGLLHQTEISHDFVVNINYHLQIGQLIKVKVIEIDDRGRVMLSIKALDSSEREQPELGKVYEGKVNNIVGYGAFVSLLPGINGLLHKTQISQSFVDNVNDHLQIGQRVKVKIIGINGNGGVELSMKALVSFEPEVGRVYLGTVIKILDSYAIVKLRPGIKGILRISEIAHEYIENINDHLQIGQRVKVKVIEIFKKGNLLLSMKEYDSSEPERGKIYLGRVKAIVKYGAFVRLRPGIHGLLHISEIAHEHVGNVNDYLEEGQLIKVKVIEIDVRGKISLTQMALDSPKHEPAEVQTEPEAQPEQPELGKLYEGKVLKFFDSGDGATVSLLPGINGLLDKSEISGENIENVCDHLQIGQLITVKAIKIEDKGHVWVSMKALLSTEPGIGMVYEGEVKKILRQFAYISLLPGRTGLLHKSGISDENIENVCDHLQIGQTIKVKVINADDRGRVRLSMKALDSTMPEAAEVQSEQEAQPEFGKLYEGKVIKFFDKGDGATVSLRPGITGLLDISEISDEKIENVNNHLRIGQLITVKAVNTDDSGRLWLSMKGIDSSKREPAEVQTVRLELGKVYTGKVKKILNKGADAIVSLLPGMDGLLNKSEIAHKHIENISDHLQIGQQIKVKTIKYDQTGLMWVSMKALDSSEPELGKLYEGRVLKLFEDGAAVSLLPGINGLLDISEIAPEHIENSSVNLRKGQQIKVKAIKYDDRGRVWLSMMALDSSKREQPEPGKVYMGKVCNILDNGAIVSLLPGCKGLLPISEISHEHAQNVNDHLQIGQMIKVMVIKTDDNGGVQLSRKALDSSKLEMPELGKVYEGEVKKIYGKNRASVSLLTGRTGLLHVSEIAHKHIKNISDHLQEGQRIKVKTINYDDRGRVWLSMKALDSLEPEQPELGKVYECKVAKILPRGDAAIVSLLPGCKGMLHKSEIAGKFVENINDHLYVSQKIKVKMIRTDDFGRPWLSMKALDSSEREQTVLPRATS